MNGLDLIASLLSAGIFMAGSVTGVVGVVASEVGLAAKAAQAAAEAASRAALAGNRVAQVNKLDGIAAAAEKAASISGGTTRVTNALGAGLWTTASTFTMISAFTDPEVRCSSLTSIRYNCSADTPIGSSRCKRSLTSPPADVLRSPRSDCSAG